MKTISLVPLANSTRDACRVLPGQLNLLHLRGLLTNTLTENSLPRLVCNMPPEKVDFYSG